MARATKEPRTKMTDFMLKVVMMVDYRSSGVVCESVVIVWGNVIDVLTSRRALEENVFGFTLTLEI